MNSRKRVVALGLATAQLMAMAPAASVSVFADDSAAPAVVAENSCALYAGGSKEVTVEYGDTPEAIPIKLENLTGNKVDITNIELSGEFAKFKLNGPTTGTLDGGAVDDKTWSITPEATIPAKDYKLSFDVSCSDGTTTSCEVLFKVNKSTKLNNITLDKPNVVTDGSKVIAYAPDGFVLPPDCKLQFGVSESGSGYDNVTWCDANSNDGLSCTIDSMYKDYEYFCIRVSSNGDNYVLSESSPSKYATVKQNANLVLDIDPRVSIDSYAYIRYDTETPNSTTFQVTNSGGSAATITKYKDAINDEVPLIFKGLEVGTIIEPGETKEITVTPKSDLPSSHYGTYFIVYYNDGVNEVGAGTYYYDFTITGASMPDPIAPTFKYDGVNTVTVNPSEKDKLPNDCSWQYAIVKDKENITEADITNWSNSPEITVPELGTYRACVRFYSDGNNYIEDDGSEICHNSNFIVSDETFTVASLLKGLDVTVPEIAEFEYGQTPAAVPVEITNSTSNEITVEASVSGDLAVEGTSAVIAAGGTNSAIKVKPASDLDAGEHKGTIIIKDKNEPTRTTSAEIIFNIALAKPEIPSDVTVSAAADGDTVTVTTSKDIEVTGECAVEYALVADGANIAEAEWQPDNIFTGVKNGIYTAYVRITGDKNHENSEPLPAAKKVTVSDSGANLETLSATVDFANEKIMGLGVATYKILVGGGTVNVSTTMVGLSIEESWFGQTLQIVKVDDNGAALSKVLELSIGGRPTAPTGIAFNEDKTKITGVKDTMEYQVPGTEEWTSVPTGATEITVTEQGKYLVRLKATDTKFASVAFALSTVLEAEETPNANYRFIDATFTGLETGSKYTFTYKYDTGTYSTTVTIGEDGTTEITPVFFGHEISIIKLGDNITTKDSEPQILEVPACRPAPEVQLSDDKTKIIGVTEDMEYLIVAGTWTDVKGSEIEITDGNRYYDIRLKGSETQFPSLTTRIDVLAGTGDLEILNASVDFANETIMGLGAATYKILVGGGTVKVATAMVGLPIEESWFGQTLHIVKIDSKDDTVLSEVLDLPIAARPEAPADVKGSTNGKITGVTAAMEYMAEDGSEWIPVEETEITVTEAGTYLVRYKATAEVFASKPVSIAVTVDGKKVPAETPNAEIDYAAEVLKGLKIGDYKIDNVDVKIEQTDGLLAIDPDWFGKTITIVKLGDGTVTTDSEAQKLVIPARPETPAAAGTDNGTITGVTAAMEYKLHSGSEWKDCAGTEIKDLAAGIYHIRVKATDKSFASEIKVVKVEVGGSGEVVEPDVLTLDEVNFGSVAVGNDFVYKSLVIKLNGEVVTPDKLTIDSFSKLNNFYIDKSSTGKWVVKFNKDLTAGAYEEILTVNYEGLIATAKIVLTLTPQTSVEPSTPSRPSSGGSSSGSTSGGTSSGSSSSAPVSSESGATGWTDINKDIEDAMAAISGIGSGTGTETGTETGTGTGTGTAAPVGTAANPIKITLGADALVPSTTIVAAARSKAVIEFKVDDTFAWQVDGSQISGKVKATSFAVKPATVETFMVKQTAGLENIDAAKTKSFTLSDIQFDTIKPKLSASFGKENTGSFANLYEVDPVTGELKFVETAKIDENGNVILPVDKNATFVVAVDKESKKPGDFSNDGVLDARDVSSLMKEVISGDLSTQMYKADFNGDGKVNALDAMAILRALLNP